MDCLPRRAREVRNWFEGNGAVTLILVTDVLGADREPGSALRLADQFRFDAGSPALNLLATRGYRGADEPVERLTSPARLGDWLAANGLPDVDVDGRAVTQARALREAAYATLAAVAANGPPRATDVATLSRWATRPASVPALTLGADGVAWESVQPTFRGVLGELARQLAAIAVDRPAGLRMCASDVCRMLYLDRSHGHRRRWCSMSRCGNVAKVARHRSQSDGAR
jgi:predicted RNA-binding Zn ribbon-like protein